MKNLFNYLRNIFDDRNPEWHSAGNIFGYERMRRWRLGKFEYRDMTREEAGKKFADEVI